MIDEKILLEQIKTFKRSQKSVNCDYLTGYISALSAVEGMIAEQPKVGEWIPCSEKLPEQNVPVLTCDKNGWISVNINVPYQGKKNDFECGYYLAWQSLPEKYNGVD